MRIKDCPNCGPRYTKQVKHIGTQCEGKDTVLLVDCKDCREIYVAVRRKHPTRIDMGEANKGVKHEKES